jgi:hypothetical protein
MIFIGFDYTRLLVDWTVRAYLLVPYGVENSLFRVLGIRKQKGRAKQIQVTNRPTNHQWLTLIIRWSHLWHVSIIAWAFHPIPNRECLLRKGPDREWLFLTNNGLCDDSRELNSYVQCQRTINRIYEDLIHLCGKSTAISENHIQSIATSSYHQACNDFLEE